MKFMFFGSGFVGIFIALLINLLLSLLQLIGVVFAGVFRLFFMIINGDWRE